MERFRLLVWELRMLADKMRVAADPYAEPLEHALDRFTDPLEEDPSMTTELEPIEGATVIQCATCGSELMVMPGEPAPTLEHHDNGEHTYHSADPDVRNDPIPEPVRQEPLPGEPPEPHSDPKPEPPSADDDPSPGYLTPEPDPTGPEVNEAGE